MAIFNDFPYSNLHNENLQWIIDTLKQSGSSIGEISTALEQVQEEIANLDILQTYRRSQVISKMITSLYAAIHTA